MMRTGSEVFDVLVNEVLPVEACGDDRFVGTQPADSLGRVYGGQLAAQGLRAAAQTVDGGRQVHSLHVGFLGLGDPGAPLGYDVQRLRDSRMYGTRLVQANQDERAIATMTVSFQAPRPGLEHGVGAQPGPVPDPSSLPTRAELAIAAFGSDAPATATLPWPIDIRYIDHPPWAVPPTGPAPATNRLWLRGAGELDDDPLGHACVLAYASDLTMFEPVAYRHNPPAGPSLWEQLSRGARRGATLDHSIWFHRPFRADEWLLHEQDSPVAYGSRGLSTGRFFDLDGHLVASVAQEVAILADPSDLTSADPPRPEGTP
jgi:acyl-CoA thioesterase-2